MDDRILKIIEPVTAVLTPAAVLALRELDRNREPGSYLIQQLNSCWAYLQDAAHLRLVTRAITITARAAAAGTNYYFLSCQEIQPTNQPEVTVAFRDGYKVIAVWQLSEAQEIGKSQGTEGALQLWLGLGGDADEIEAFPESARIVPNWSPPAEEGPPAEQEGPSLAVTNWPPPVMENLAADQDEYFPPMVELKPGPPPEPQPPNPSDNASEPPPDLAPLGAAPASAQVRSESVPASVVDIPLSKAAADLPASASIPFVAQPILAQSEIDRLIVSLRGGKEEIRAADPPVPRPDEALQSSTPPPQTFGESAAAPPDAGPPWKIGTELPEISPPAQTGLPNASMPAESPDTLPQAVPGISDSHEETPVPEPVRPPEVQSQIFVGVGPEDWTTDGHETVTSAPAARPQDAVKKPLNFEGICADHPYNLIVFAKREDLLSALKETPLPKETSLLAFWQNESIQSRLSASHRDRIEHLRNKYRGAAVILESSITRLRQTQQLIPHLQRYRDQQTALAEEASKNAQAMKDLRLKHLLSTHEGRAISHKVFVLEGQRQKTLGLLARHSHLLLRKAKPSLPFRSTFFRVNRRFLQSQIRLESAFDRLSVLDIEIQRRLEYQADWQALIRTQVKIRRDMDEVSRFLRASSFAGAAQSGDAEAMNQWLEAEWEGTRRREKFLRSWQGCLADEASWAVRAIEEPMAIFTDLSALGQPLMLKGANLVILAPQTVLDSLKFSTRDCAAWTLLNPDLQTMGTGRGIDSSAEPLPQMVAELAQANGLDFEEAMRVAGLQETTGAPGPEAAPEGIEGARDS